ncbi:alcohol oxidase [Lentinus tigrinus ALCF2SS1-7]|uniref:alcohol oxidase n=1 Tax=Lentinus tigrinus ALCF2SS1-7 TaxID=1328758 RepID=UPI00116610C2|nr:alcohol oxidase [Lentinus tigrinus ALCF2SS1-7]
MDSLTTASEVSGKSFDYIVIGGGTAGLVVACRLTEDPSKTVLVLEARGAHFDDPLIYPQATVPQKHSEGTTFSWARGKGLGGSSSTNFYLWTRPSKRDVDACERLGNPGWNWDNFLKYSKKCETFIPMSEEVTTAERLTYDMEVHGTDGPIITSFPNLRPGYEVVLQDAFDNLGIPRLAEPTNKRITSVGLTAYLKKAGSRTNLKIVLNASVFRILLSLDSDEFVANGVEFLVDGQKHAVLTTLGGEVILSAGYPTSTINSPKILELSGIGDRTILNSLGIETKVDLPAVGTNVQEHMFAGLAYGAFPAPWIKLKTPEKFNTIDPLWDPATAKSTSSSSTHPTHLNNERSLLTRSARVVPMEKIEANIPEPDDVPGNAEQVALMQEGAANAEFLSIPGFYSFPSAEVKPGPSAHTDEDLALWLNKHATTLHHACDSCSMLPIDKGGVVDPELRVYGTKGLRVLDLSVIPLIPSAHTQSVVYALAEQASDIIKGHSEL